MSTLDAAMAGFIAVHGKYQLAGRFEPQPLAESAWPQRLPQARELAYFYSRFNPVGVDFETGFAPVKLASFEALEKFQLGYRWRELEPKTEPIASWPGNHLVIMDDFGGGKPIIATLDGDRTQVFASYGGEPFKVADSLGDFITALAELIALIYGTFEIFEVADDDGIKPEFFEAMQRKVAPVLGEDNFLAFTDYFYG